MCVIVLHSFPVRLTDLFLHSHILKYRVKEYVAEQLLSEQTQS